MPTLIQLLRFDDMKNISFRSFEFPFRKILSFVLLLPSIAVAGDAGGPYVVWVNLDRSLNKSVVDQMIADFVVRKSINCDDQWKLGDSLLYMKRRPALIDDGLVRDIFLKKSKAKLKHLNAALKNYRDDEFPHHEGLDGLIVYTGQPEMKMMSFTRGRHRIESLAIASKGDVPSKEDVEEAFCALLPPITRAP